MPCDAAKSNEMVTIIKRYDGTEGKAETTLMKISSKCHSHEAQPSRGTKRMRDEVQIRTT